MPSKVSKAVFRGITKSLGLTKASGIMMGGVAVMSAEAVSPE